jgi:carboxyl-terminal processing protease
MKTRILTAVLVALFVVSAFIVGYVYGQSAYAPLQVFGPASMTPSDAQAAFRPFWETWQLVNDEYFDQPLDDRKLAEGAIEGMLSTLGDPNTRYLSPDQEQAARETMDGSFEGIGAVVTSEDGRLTIIAAYEGSPAQAAGLKGGDVLLSADGVSLAGMDTSEAAALIQGPAGTSVKLLVERNGEQFTVAVTRDVIQVPSAQGEMLEDNIAYLQLSRFANNTSEELNSELEKLMANDPVGLILDLRNNPGGNLTTAVDVADQFLGSGPVLTERFGNGRERVYDATPTGLAQDIPLVVLIDGGSASASEVLAGAIRDRDRGILIGDTSYGKGTVQTWQRLSNGGGVRITIARWLTPDGTWVHEAGLQPDYTVTRGAGEEVEQTDAQLQAAIDYIEGKPVIESAPANEG